MNPHAEPPASLQGMFRTLWVHRQLIARMSQREVIGRYRGSALGLVWSFLTPLFMLAIYTFVFSVVFKARWGAGEESRTQFAVVLFAGLIVHALFAEVINRAPQLVLGNVNYVKKVVFPLEILPVVQLVAAVFHGFGAHDCIVFPAGYPAFADINFGAVLGAGILGRFCA